MVHKSPHKVFLYNCIEWVLLKILFTLAGASQKSVSLTYYIFISSIYFSLFYLKIFPFKFWRKGKKKRYIKVKGSKLRVCKRLEGVTDGLQGFAKRCANTVRDRLLTVQIYVMRFFFNILKKEWHLFYIKNSFNFMTCYFMLEFQIFFFKAVTNQTKSYK